ncbi:hypothetical protein [Flavobacterium sp.]|jgi:hypothetical protein|uniref:hypothetical protein n=1 Tax=Flavobacterium sp. TaxID=239 RepID=UPI0037C179F5
MKNVLLGLMVMVTFLFEAKAQEKQTIDQQCDFKSGSIVVSFNKERIEYKFTSLDDLNEQVDEISKEIDFADFTNKKEVCEIIVELKLEIAIGATRIRLSEIIKTNCTEATTSEAARKLKAMLVAATIG